MKLPLADLLLRLEKEGFAIDPSTQLKLQQVLHQLGDDYRHDPVGLARILCPLVAHSETEQHRFQEVFQQYLGQYVQTGGIAESVAPAQNQYISQQVRRRRVWVYPMAVLSMMLLFVAWNHWQGQDPLREVLDHPTEEMAEKADSSLPAEGNVDREEIYARQSSPSEVSNTLSATFSVDPTYPAVNQPVRFRLITPPGPGAQINWQIRGPQSELQVRDQVNPSFTPKEVGPYEIRVSINAPEQAETFASHTMHLPIYPARLTAQDRTRAELLALTRHQNQLKLFTFILALLSIFLLEGYFYYYKKRLVRLTYQREFLENPAGQYEIPHEDREIRLEPEPAFYTLAERMRQQQQGSVSTLDVPKTLYATVRSGGMPQLQYQERKVGTEYLILIDESEPNRQSARLFRQVLELLQKEEVFLTAYHFRNDPRVVWQKGQNEQELTTLARKYPKHHLLVFSRGTYFVHPTENRLQDWVAPAFERWEHKILLSSTPPQDWSRREKALEDVFRLVPAHLTGQLGILEALESDGYTFSAAQQQAPLARQSWSPVLEKVDFETVEGLEAYLGESLFEWISAAMVAPRLRWETVITIGEALQSREGNETHLLSYDKLLKLSQIPWLESGEVPPALQNQLLRQLDPETERLVRKAVLQQLQTQPKALENKVQTVVQAAALSPRDTGLQEKMRFLYQEGLLQRFSGENWKEHFHPRWGDRFLRIEWLGYLLLGLALGGAGKYVGDQRTYYQTEAIMARHQPDTTQWAAFSRIMDQTGEEGSAADFSAQQEWQSVWGQMNQMQTEQAVETLREILRNPLHPYFQPAASLYREWQSPWRNE